MLVRGVLLIALWLAFPVLAVAGGGQIYKWVDKDGNTHFSDCPPPPDCTAEEVVKAPLPSEKEAVLARKKLDQMIREQEASYEARKKAKEEREAKRALALALAVVVKRECASSRQNLHIFEQTPARVLDRRRRRIHLPVRRRTTGKNQPFGEIYRTELRGQLTCTAIRAGPKGGQHEGDSFTTDTQVSSRMTIRFECA